MTLPLESTSLTNPEKGVESRGELKLYHTPEEKAKNPEKRVESSADISSPKVGNTNPEKGVESALPLIVQLSLIESRKGS